MCGKTYWIQLQTNEKVEKKDEFVVGTIEAKNLEDAKKEALMHLRAQEAKVGVPYSVRVKMMGVYTLAYVYDGKAWIPQHPRSRS